MRTESSLYELIRTARESDPLAQKTLFDKYAPLLNAAVGKSLSGRVFSPSDKDDLHQEATLAFFSAVDRFDLSQDRVSFGAFAKKCIRNRLTSVYRRRLREIAREQKRARQPAEPPADPSRVSDAFPENYAQILADAEKLLSKKELVVFRLRRSNKSYGEIAQLLGCSVKSVDNALKRAKSKMKDFARRE